MKTITKKQFRILLTLSIVTLVASVIAGVLADSWLLPQPLLDYQRAQHGVRPKTSELVIGFLGIPGLIAGCVSIIGLYRFWPSARWLSVTAWIYMLAVMPFTPWPVISNALAGALSQCSTLLAGVVLALIYFSPAAAWFRKEDRPLSPNA
jgi:hypothetical protein